LAKHVKRKLRKGVVLIRLLTRKSRPTFRSYRNSSSAKHAHSTFHPNKHRPVSERDSISIVQDQAHILFIERRVLIFGIIGKGLVPHHALERGSTQQPPRVPPAPIRKFELGRLDQTTKPCRWLSSKPSALQAINRHTASSMRIPDCYWAITTFGYESRGDNWTRRSPS
jgi:hypothetical protein